MRGLGGVRGLLPQYCDEHLAVLRHFDRPRRFVYPEAVPRRPRLSAPRLAQPLARPCLRLPMHCEALTVAFNANFPTQARPTDWQRNFRFYEHASNKQSKQTKKRTMVTRKKIERIHD